MHILFPLPASCASVTPTCHEAARSSIERLPQTPTRVGCHRQKEKMNTWRELMHLNSRNVSRCMRASYQTSRRSHRVGCTRAQSSLRLRCNVDLTSLRLPYRSSQSAILLLNITDRTESFSHELLH